MLNNRRYVLNVRSISFSLAGSGGEEGEGDGGGRKERTEREGEMATQQDNVTHLPQHIAQAQNPPTVYLGGLGR